MICGSVFLVALGVATAAADVYPGSYAAKGKGVTAKLEVAESGGGRLAYAIKSACGKSKGKVELSKSGTGLKGRRVGRGPEGTLQTTVAKVALSGAGDQVAGSIKESFRGGDSDLAGCEAKRTFTADVDQAEGFVPTRDAGHYAGAAANGLPISFDVVDDGGNLRVENLAVDAEEDCLDESDPDADDVSMTGHVAGMSGRVAKDGSFFIDYAPDDDTDYTFEGAIADGKAEVDVMLDGYFDALGYPNPAGPFYCEGWGDLYKAALD